LNRAKPLPDPKLKRSFDASLERTRQLAGRVLARDPRNENAQLATVLRLGLQADYLGLIEKKYLASLSAMKEGRKVAQALIAGNPNSGDAYLALGVENYLLGQKAAPLRWLLRAGGAQADSERGVRYLLLTAERGHYLAPYARVLLAVAALRGRDTARAKVLLQGLDAEFPNNRLYAEEIARLR
jgi:hypothetical protein